jgi:hypothetical protein
MPSHRIASPRAGRPRRARLPLLGLLAAPLLCPAPTEAADYFVGARTQLTADRWRGTRHEPVERLDVRPRLRLGVFDLEDDGAATDRFRFVADLEVGADFGRTQAERDASKQVLGETRRAQFDLYFAYFEGHLVQRRSLGLTVVAGRHLLLDAVGLDAVDGVTVRVAVPFVRLEGTGGLAVRSGWSNVGPDIYSPDGTLLHDVPAYLVGAAAETDLGDRVVFRGAWRRQFEDASHVQRDEVGGGLEVTPLRGLSFSAGTRFDAIFRRVANLEAGAGYSFLDAWRAEVAWRREHPTFSADSIWNAFSIEPYHDVSGRLRFDPGLWRLSADGGVRRFDGGEPHAAAGAIETTRNAYDGGLRGERLLGAPEDDMAVGAEGRAGLGYGGRRIYGDVFGRMPIALKPGVAPLRLGGRLGAVHFEDEQQAELSGVSGWAVATVGWKAAESVELELLGEGHASRFTPFRGRLFAQVTLEEWL